MLEDDFTYVLKKALRGQALSLEDVADKSGLPGQQLGSFSRGRFDPHIAAVLAETLGLSPEAYAAHMEYHPDLLELPDIQRLVLPFNGDHVNAWLVSKGTQHLLFDTGNDPESAIAELARLKIEPSAVFLTHGHPDHISGMDAFSVPKYGPRIDGAIHVDPGTRFTLDEISLRAVDLSGHFNPSLGYIIEGLSQPVLVAGDAIFAGSIGGCDREHYHDAILRIKAALASLGDHTVILPGHGPPTTVGGEKRGNPFLA
jgi:hydroxyacylglutathione hydrolase